MTATNYAVAPGEYLEEWIDDHGLSQQRVAELLGSSRKQVNEIVNGRAPITSDTATMPKLLTTFSTPPGSRSRILSMVCSATQPLEV